MKNLSIRMRIMAGVLLVNLVGGLAIMVYLHQSYSTAIQGSATRTLTLGAGAWQQLTGAGAKFDTVASPAKVVQALGKMSAITGAQYGLLVDKTAVTAAAYAKMRKQVGQPNNWAENQDYALFSVTQAAAAKRMRFAVPSGDVPETGKVVGVENGACSQTCHNGVTGKGDYWTVRWSSDAKTHADAVFPVNNAKGSPVGVVYATEDLSAQADAARGSMLQTLWVVGITLVVATLVISFLIDRLVLRRLAAMSQSMEDIGLRVAGGDFGAHFLADGTHDEIGSLEEFFARFIDVVLSTLSQLSGRGKEGA